MQKLPLPTPLLFFGVCKVALYLYINSAAGAELFNWLVDAIVEPYKCLKI